MPLSFITEILNFEIEIQCQSNVLSESLIIMVNSTAYNITQPSLVSKFNVTINQTGYDISAQCIWSANGGIFMDETIVNGKVCFYLFHFNDTICSSFGSHIECYGKPNQYSS